MIENLYVDSLWIIGLFDAFEKYLSAQSGKGLLIVGLYFTQIILSIFSKNGTFALLIRLFMKVLSQEKINNAQALNSSTAFFIRRLYKNARLLKK